MFDPCFFSTNQDVRKRHSTPSDVILFILRSFVLEKLYRGKKKKKELVNCEEYQMSCNGGVMNVNQWSLMQKTAASGRAACKVMRLWWCAGARLWSLHLVQELCWGNKGERHWPPSPQLCTSTQNSKGSRTDPLVSSPPSQHTPFSELTVS